MLLEKKKKKEEFDHTSMEGKKIKIEVLADIYD